MEEFWMDFRSDGRQMQYFVTSDDRANGLSKFVIFA